MTGDNTTNLLRSGSAQTVCAKQDHLGRSGDRHLRDGAITPGSTRGGASVRHDFGTFDAAIPLSEIGEEGPNPESLVMFDILQDLKCAVRSLRRSPLTVTVTASASVVTSSTSVFHVIRPNVSISIPAAVASSFNEYESVSPALSSRA